MTVRYGAEAAQELQAQIHGRVITPDGADYDQLRQPWSLSVNQHPALILVPEDTDDVVAGVRFARETGLGVAVQSTGHGPQRPADDSLLILTSRLASVEVDPEARVARVGAGVLWHHVLAVTAQYGLAPLLGSSPHVGVVGYSLGGGIGWLVRRYGLAADSVRAVELVTADGVLRRASADENADLFWGLRGGGGNFGVVTALEFELYPVATLYGGHLLYPADRIGDVLRFFRQWTATTPAALTSSLAVIKFPPLPALPEHLRGRTVVIVRAAYAGPAAAGAALLQPWLDWQTPLENNFREMPFSEVGTISNDPVAPSAGYGTNVMFDALSDDALDAIARHATNPASPLLIAELRHVGGAMSQVADEANAIGNRDVQYILQFGGLVATPDAYQAVGAYIRTFREALAPYASNGVYLNFMSGSEARGRAADAYGAPKLERLQILKRLYDPDNLFRYAYQLGDTPTAA